MDDLDDFQTDYLVPLTPEEDEAYRGCCGPMLVVLGFVVLVIVLALVAAL